MKSQNSEFNHLKIILLHILVNKNWEMKNLDISNNIKNRKKKLTVWKLPNIVERN